MSANNENVFEVFDALVNALSVPDLLHRYHHLNHVLSLQQSVGTFQYFQRLKKCLSKSKQILKFNKISSILQKLDKRSQLKFYHNNRALNGQRVLVIGGGISGLRVAIELLLLGANVLCVDKRDQFSRNNVIHLWPNVIEDLRLLGAKRFYGKFCVGAIDHVAIRQIQLILLKIALIFGLRFAPNVTFDRLCPRLSAPSQTPCARIQCQCCCHSHDFSGGANAHFSLSPTQTQSPSQSQTPLNTVSELNRLAFDVIVGSDGRRNTLFQDFPRKEFRGKLAIAITANFVNRRTEREVRVPEISGVSYIYHQKWFRALFDELDIQLENICYYRNETHYFVMTATKQSLLSRGVLTRDWPETHLLLADENIDRKELLRYARDAAHWTSGLRDLEFAQNANLSADVALFDFTSVYAARNASRAKRVFTACCEADVTDRTRHVLMLLTGDSLLEPFWPTGSGAGRGFLSALDAAYTCLQWALKVKDSSDQWEESYESMVDVIAERESIYRMLAQTKPENICSKDFSLLPQNRYKNWSKNSIQEIRSQIKHLIGFQSIVDNKTTDSMAAKRARRATVAVTTRDFDSSQSQTESELEFELLKREMESKRLKERNDGNIDRQTTTVSSVSSLSSSVAIKSKANWLLGGMKEEEVGEEEGERPKPKVEIIERAQRLEEMIYSNENTFEPKLSRVGRIEENDWNFRVWSENALFDPKTSSEAKSPKPLPKNTREILKSRKTQIEAKMTSESVPKTTKVVPRDRQWVQKMSAELTQRMAKDCGNRFTEETTRTTSVAPSLMPRCSRCGLDVTAMERISVSGDVLHRSCLRCAKCGISLRLNEFRTELKFLCIYCLKSNETKNQTSLRAKQQFLERVDKIDFRERIEFENGVVEVVTKTPLNDHSDSGSDEDFTLDLTESDDNSSECDINSTTSSDESDDWVTQSDDDSSDDTTTDDDERRPKTTTTTATTTATTDSPSISNKSIASVSQSSAVVFPPVLCRPRTRRLLTKLFP